jgi:hypothetical protein
MPSVRLRVLTAVNQRAHCPRARAPFAVRIEAATPRA